MKWWHEANSDITLPWKYSFKDPDEKRTWAVKGSIQYITPDGTRGVYRTNFRRIVTHDKIEAAEIVIKNIEKYLLKKNK